MREVSIFISYDFMEDDLLINLLKKIAVIQKDIDVNITTSSSIGKGEDRIRTQIQEFNSSDIIIILISQEHISSPLFQDKKVFHFLNDASKHVIPIICTEVNCDKIAWLKDKLVYPNNDNTFAQLSNRKKDTVLNEVSKKVKSIATGITLNEISKNDPISQAEVFISHNKKDGDFAELLKIKLKESGFSVWLDVDRVRVGEDWMDAIDQSIRKCFALIVIMSPKARKSEYVTYEWVYALGVGKKVFPVKIKNTPLHPRLEAMQYLDFRIRSGRPWQQLIDSLWEEVENVRVDGNK